MAVGEAQHLRPHHVPAPAAAPGLGRLHHRHEHFLRTGAVEFLAHDALHLAQDAHAEGEPVVAAGGKAADEARPHEQNVAGDFRVGRRFAERGNEELAVSQRSQTSKRC